MMFRPIRTCLFLLLCLPSWCSAANLAFSVSGLEGEPQRNVLAWLGNAPDTLQERLNFVVSARDRVERSLQALGFYHPEIDIEVQRTDPVWQVAIAVDPGEPVRIRNINIQILGPAANDLKFARLVYEVDFTAGDVLHHGQYESFRNSLLALGSSEAIWTPELS